MCEAGCKALYIVTSKPFETETLHSRHGPKVFSVYSAYSAGFSLALIQSFLTMPHSLLQKLECVFCSSLSMQCWKIIFFFNRRSNLRNFLETLKRVYTILKQYSDDREYFVSWDCSEPLMVRSQIGSLNKKCIYTHIYVYTYHTLTHTYIFIYIFEHLLFRWWHSL